MHRFDDRNVGRCDAFRPSWYRRTQDNDGETKRSIFLAILKDDLRDNKKTNERAWSLVFNSVVFDD